MKNLKKLVIASFMLVIAFVAVVSSTYAWFTRGQEATVNNISIGVVDASKSLLIGRENGVWSRSVTVKPFGKMTPVTLRSASLGQAGEFQQLEWDENLVPSMVNSKVLNEEYVKTTDAAIDPNKTYYTMSVNTNNDVTFTEVANPDVANIKDYYEKPEATKEYIQATSYDAAATYYTVSNNVYTEVPADEKDAANLSTYYVKNPAYVAEGYIKFELYFQITVDAAAEWDSTTIQMNLTNLHAFDVDNNGDVTSTENPNALSSFRMAIAEGANPTAASITKIIEGKSENVGTYGDGNQFALTNGWLAMLNNSAINANDAIISDGQAAFELAQNYKDAKMIDSSVQKEYDQSEAEFEYEMDCDSSCLAVIGTSGDGLTKTFKITVYVWMEGWDGDNVNAAAGCQYIFGLSFRAI